MRLIVACSRVAQERTPEERCSGGKLRRRLDTRFLLREQCACASIGGLPQALNSSSPNESHRSKSNKTVFQIGPIQKCRRR